MSRRFVGRAGMIILGTACLTSLWWPHWLVSGAAHIFGLIGFFVVVLQCLSWSTDSRDVIIRCNTKQGRCSCGEWHSSAPGIIEIEFQIAGSDDESKPVSSLKTTRWNGE